jgi:hypothetical protein
MIPDFFKDCLINPKLTKFEDLEYVDNFGILFKKFIDFRAEIQLPDVKNEFESILLNRIVSLENGNFTNLGLYRKCMYYALIGSCLLATYRHLRKNSSNTFINVLKAKKIYGENVKIIISFLEALSIVYPAFPKLESNYVKVAKIYPHLLSKYVG